MTRQFLKNLNLLNLLLLGLLIILARYVIYPAPEPGLKPILPAQQTETVENSSDEKNSIPSSSADYMIIAEQNPFHPERKIPVEKKAEQPLPIPDFVLYGTLITDDLSIAYMEDLKSPLSTPGRGKRQTPLKIGQSLSGFTLKEIEAEKVVMVRGDERMTVYLNDPNTPKKREAAIASAAPGTAATPSIRTTQRGHEEQKQTAARSPSEQAQQTTVIPPARERTKPKEPLTPEQANKARDAFLKFFQRR